MGASVPDQATRASPEPASSLGHTASVPRASEVRRFTVFRPCAPETHDSNQKNAPDQPQFEGVIFSDGTCVLRWLTAMASTSVWADFGTMAAIHGHPEYGTYFVWHDGPPA